jgi:DNA-binding CsgD family transcriptional regulator
MALPIHVNRRLLVSFVFNRRKVAFTDEERDLADVLCPHLAYLYRLYAAAQGVNESVPFAPSHTAAVLTAREREVLQWVAAGKTNRDVAAILKVGLRTVEKHLEHIYEKLGVETRTAAVMRACAAQRPTRAPSLLVS